MNNGEGVIGFTGIKTEAIALIIAGHCEIDEIRNLLINVGRKSIPRAKAVPVFWLEQRARSSAETCAVPSMSRTKRLTTKIESPIVLGVVVAKAIVRCARILGLKLVA